MGPTDIYPSAGAPPEIELLGVPVSNISFDALWAGCEQCIASRKPGFVVTPNLDHIVMYREEAAFRQVYARAMFRTPDSTPVMWLARLLGTPLQEKLPGSDLVPRIARRAALGGYSVFCFGAGPGVADRAAAEMVRHFPGLRIAGTYCPPMGFQQDAGEKAKALDAVKKARPDICFVALGAPRQEYWMMETIEQDAWSVALGIGAGLDFISGQRRRAPAWVQRIGCEWLWRTAFEPRRLGPRYWRDAVTLGPLVLKELAGRLTGKG